MKLTLLLAGLATLVAACPPPFNDFRFFGNDTDTVNVLKENVLAVHANGTAALGWTDGVTLTNGALQPWPATDGNHTINYCYARPDERVYFKNWVEAGAKIWMDAIGAPSKESGHSLKIQELPFKEGDYKYCYVEDKSTPTPDFKWNPALPGDTLTIKATTAKANSDMNAAATLGYMYPYWHSGDGRHQFFINYDTMALLGNTANRIIAHELGHVMGFYHEHQRTDRDHYVFFKCEALPGYDQVKDMLDRESDPRFTMKDVCESWYIGHFYNFAAPVYSTQTAELVSPNGQKAQWYKNPGKDYDVDSIMHYASEYNRPLPDDSRDWHLAKWVDGGPEFEPPEGEPKAPNIEPIFWRPSGLSKWDVEGVKVLYPWTKD